MPTTFPRVNPGQVIRAADFNQVLAALEDLYSQIGAVSTTAVSITSFMPPGPVKVGDQVTILGRNFQYSIGAESVFFGGVPVNTFLSGSSDTQLIVNVPLLTNLPDQGQAVTVTVYNRTGSDSKQITVLPPPVLLQNGASVSAGAFTGTPTAGQTANFPFTVTSNLSQTRSITISATITPSSFQADLKVLNPSMQTLGQISLAPNTSTSFIVSFVIPAGATGQFGISAIATDVETGTPLNTSAQSTYTIGQQSQTDPNIQFGTIKLINSAQGQGNAYSSANNTITLPANSWVMMQVSTLFKGLGKYSVTATVGASATGWTSTLVYPGPGQVLDYSVSLPATATNLQFNVITGAGPLGSGQLTLQVQAQGQTTSNSVSFNVASA